MAQATAQGGVAELPSPVDDGALQPGSVFDAPASSSGSPAIAPASPSGSPAVAPGSSADSPAIAPAREKPAINRKKGPRGDDDFFVHWFKKSIRERIVNIIVYMVQPGGEKIRVGVLNEPITYQQFLAQFPDDGVYSLAAYDSRPGLVTRAERVTVRHPRPAGPAAPEGGQADMVKLLLEQQEQRLRAEFARPAVAAPAPVAQGVPTEPRKTSEDRAWDLLATVMGGGSGGGPAGMTADQALKVQGRGFDAGKELGEQAGYTKGFADGQNAVREELADRFGRLNQLAQQLAGEKREMAGNREDFYREQRQVLTRQPEPHVPAPAYPQAGQAGPQTGPDPFADPFPGQQQPAGDWDPEIEAILSGQAIPQPDEFEEPELGLDLEEEPELDLDDGDEQLDVDDEEQDDEQGGDDEPEIQDHPPEDVPVWGDDDPPDDAD